MSQLQAHGLTIQAPSGWEGRIFRRRQAGDRSAQSEVPGPVAPAGEQTFPVAQVATIALAPTVADFASDAVEDLGPTDAIIVLKEYAPANVTQTLFASSGIPRPLDPDWFDPGVLNRRLAGQAGVQRFFNQTGRAFCLYVVLGAYQRRTTVVPRVNTVLTAIQIDPLGAKPTPSTSTTTTSTPGGTPTTSTPPTS